MNQIICIFLNRLDQGGSRRVFAEHGQDVIHNKTTVGGGKEYRSDGRWKQIMKNRIFSLAIIFGFQKGLGVSVTRLVCTWV